VNFENRVTKTMLAFAGNLKRIRTGRGWCLVTTAAITGVPIYFLNKLERAQYKGMHGDFWIGLAMHMDCELSALFEDI
jgi:hypothetical protein